MQVWKKFLKEQEEELGIETVQKWLKTLNIIRFDACNLYLEAKDAFQAMWFEEHIRPKIQNKLCNNNKKKIKVHLSVLNASQKAKEGSLKSKKKPSQAARFAFSLTFDELDPSCTFDSFITSEANKFTYKFFSQISLSQNARKDSDSLFFNPVYLYGGPGSGKTHLLMAAAEALRKQKYHAIYSRAQTFTNHVVSAIRAGEMPAFRESYRNSDVLIIDDIHVLSRKGATQEEFFHTFNTLHGEGKQIILSSNSPPDELQHIEPRLISRFAWGIVLSLEMPSRTDLEKILQTKSEKMQFPLHQKVMEFLLNSFSKSISLNRAFDALILRSHLRHSFQEKNALPQITVQSAKQILSDLLQEEQQSAITPSHIIQKTAEFFGIRPEDILGTAQTRDCVFPRQLSMYLCRLQLSMPYLKIGSLFSKDHSTVMSSVKLIQKGIDADDKEIAHAYRSILKKLED